MFHANIVRVASCTPETNLHCACCLIYTQDEPAARFQLVRVMLLMGTLLHLKCYLL